MKYIVFGDQWTTTGNNGSKELMNRKKEGARTCDIDPGIIQGYVSEGFSLEEFVGFGHTSVPS